MTNCIKKLAQAWSDVTKECMNDIWKETLRSFIHNLKWGIVGLEQKHIAEEEVRKKTAEKKRKNLPRIFTVQDLAGTFADLNKLFKRFKTMNTYTKISINRDKYSWCVACFQANLWWKKSTNQENHHGYISENSDIFSRRSLDRSFRRYSRKKKCYYRRLHLMLFPIKTFQWNKM